MRIGGWAERELYPREIGLVELSIMIVSGALIVSAAFLLWSP